MTGQIGIRLEDKNEWERRVPLTPEAVRRLVRDEGIRVTVQSSPCRAFADGEYEQAGAVVANDIEECPVVFAVKEIPIELLRPERTYVYFSHVIKGQPGNMPMLRRLMELGCTLIDYERVADARGKRLIFFGFHAGLAGMVETLWSLGQRLACEGFTTPLARIRHGWQYPDVAAMRDEFSLIGEQLAREGLPAELGPLVVGFTGYGNVSRGAQDVLSAFPVETVGPKELPAIIKKAPLDRMIKVVFHECHMVERTDKTGEFDLQRYFSHPEEFESIFTRHLPWLSVLVNCIYWTDRYPRLMPLSWIRQAWSESETPRLRVVGDVSCDVNGAIECTTHVTTPAAPSFVYDPATGESHEGVAGRGPVIMAVDNLPCEIPRESSTSFSTALAPFVPALATTDYDRPFDELELPSEIKRAVIVHRGRLTPDYTYLEKHLVDTTNLSANS